MLKKCILNKFVLRIAFFLILLLLFSACMSKRITSKVNENSSLHDLLQLVPANNKTQAFLINESILKQGSAGISNLCLMLNEKDEPVRIHAEYALSALAVHVARDGVTDERKKFLEGIYRSLKEDQLRTKRTFLISLLKIAGDESSWQPLAKYLYDEDLCVLVVPTMLNLGTSVPGKALLTALPKVAGRNKIAIIQGLGESRFLPAAETICGLTHDPDPEIKAAACFALANMGYKAARPIFLEEMAVNESLSKKQAVINYLLWIRQLADKQQSVIYCREILTNADGLYTEHHRLSALAILVDISGTAGLNDVINFMNSSSEKNQLEAFHLLEQMDTALLVQKFFARKKELSPLLQAGFVDLVGKKKDPAAVSFIRNSLQDTIAIVQAAAINALVKIEQKNSVDLLLPLLENTNDSLVLSSLHTVFLGIPQQDLLPSLINHYPRMNLSGKQVVLGILKERRVKTCTDFVISQLSAAEASIRIAAMRSLPDLAEADDLPILTGVMHKITEPGEKENIFNAILMIVDRYKNDRNTIAVINDFAQNTDNSNRFYLFKLLKQSGSDPALKILLNETRTINPQIKEQALRTLIEWPRINALEHLVAVVSSKEDLTVRVLATRSCLRLLQENDLGKEIEFLYYTSILESAPRLEEKKIVIAALAAVKSEKALNYLARLIKDPDLTSEAAMAVMNIVKTTSDSTGEITRTEIVRALMNTQVKPEENATSAPLFPDEQLYNQPPEGFVAVFNGRDLEGWQGLVTDPPRRARMSMDELYAAQQQSDQNMREHWKVIDGCLCFDGQGENLCTVKSYKNFELLVDWKIEKKGDSGIYLRGSPQVQIWDLEKNNIGSGGLFNNQIGSSQPLKPADRAVGEWNTFRIIMLGPKVTVYLNEQLVVDNIVLENYWERDKPIYASNPLELQAHFNPLYFRNIFIRELPEEEMPFSGELFNGKNLSGWQVINGQPDNWQVEKEILFSTGKGGGWISTTRAFSNFKLELEFRLPAGGNSGVFIRAPQEGDPAYTGMEIQLLDDYAAEYKNLKPWQYTGSIYGIQPPMQRVTKPAGTWQKILMECQGPQIKVILNDVLILDTNLIDHMNKESTHPGIKRRTGFIGLQNHSTRAEFRNIRIQELD